MENTDTFHICAYSSIFYLIISIISYYYKEFVLSFILFILVITTINYHNKRSLINYLIDKLFVFLTITYTGYVFSNKLFNIKLMSRRDIILSIFITFSFFLTLLIYFYEVYFCEYEIICDKIHSILHFVSSIGIGYVIVM
jgi:hypothetical protein